MHPTVTIVISLVAVTDRREAGNGDGGRSLGCPVCGAALSLDQPDPQRADRLLGTCPACGGWHLLDLLPGDGGAVATTLPDRESVHSAWRGRGPTADPEAAT